MPELVVLRHAPTAWNAEHRLQGRRDIPLSEAGRHLARTWRIPKAFARYPVMVSPLTRCRETAKLLGCRAPEIEPLLIEMDWGSWEGHRLADLRRHLGPRLQAEEAKGLDMSPPEGESPRQMQARLRPLLSRIAKAENDGRLLVCHKGVLRALVSLAVAWDMTEDHPAVKRVSGAFVFDLSRENGLALKTSNLSLLP